MKGCFAIVGVVALIFLWYELGITLGVTGESWFRPVGYVIWSIPVVLHFFVNRRGRAPQPSSANDSARRVAEHVHRGGIK